MKGLTILVFYFRRPNIDAENLRSRPRLPQLDHLKWRVDVGISTRYVKYYPIIYPISCISKSENQSINIAPVKTFF